ncbi:hypothetical protein D9M68_352150 [compost metagenome]
MKPISEPVRTAHPQIYSEELSQGPRSGPVGWSERSEAQQGPAKAPAPQAIGKIRG